MSKQFILAALAAACVVATPALADSTVGNAVFPNLTLGLQFGAASQHVTPTRFTAAFDLRSRLVQFDPESTRPGLSATQSANLATHTTGTPLLTVFEFGASSKRIDLVNVLGRDMLTSSQLNQSGETPWWQHKWIWWTGGAIAAGAATMAALSKGVSDSSFPPGNPPSNGPTCDINVGGSATGNPPSDTSGCPGPLKGAPVP